MIDDVPLKLLTELRSMDFLKFWSTTVQTKVSQSPSNQSWAPFQKKKKNSQWAPSEMLKKPGNMTAPDFLMSSKGDVG